MNKSIYGVKFVRVKKKIIKGNQPTFIIDDLNFISNAPLMILSKGT